MKYVITVEGDTFEIEVGRGGQVWVNCRPYTVDLQGVDGLPEYSLLVDHRSYEAHVEGAEGDECQMVVAGRLYRARLQQQERSCPKDRAARSCFSGTGEVCAPLPGLLVAMPVAVGQQVKQGEVVAVLESMKMNLELHAPWGGVVQAVHGTPGTDVAQGEILAVIGAEQPGERES
ncbi:MAG: biotin/lipoyl-containing protein [Anaerolineae bacterium]